MHQNETQSNYSIESCIHNSLIIYTEINPWSPYGPLSTPVYLIILWLSLIIRSFNGKETQGRVIKSRPIRRAPCLCLCPQSKDCPFIVRLCFLSSTVGNWLRHISLISAVLGFWELPALWRPQLSLSLYWWSFCFFLLKYDKFIPETNFKQCWPPRDRVNYFLSRWYAKMDNCLSKLILRGLNYLPQILCVWILIRAKARIFALHSDASDKDEFLK